MLSNRYILCIPFILITCTGCSSLISKINNKSQESASLNKKNSPLKVPGSWKAASSGTHAKISTGWLKEFNSPTMTRLVMEAVNNNPNLNAAAARLRATRQGTIGSRAALQPRVSGSSSATRSRNGNGDNPRSYATSLGLTLNASWETDIWGRLKDLRKADLANYYASVEDFRAARLSLAANTAQAYCDLVTSEQLLDLAEDILVSFEKNRDIVERNYRAGVPGTRAIAVQLSRNNVASAQRDIKSRELQRDRSRRTLESLLGRYPGASLKTSNKLPDLKSSVPASIPATLVERRPDLIAAQYDIYRSAKQADASAKNLLPSISLSTRHSTGSSEVSDLFNPQFIASSIAAALTQTIYQGGELKANAQAALEENKATIYSYTNIAIRAFSEVEDALDTDQSLRKQEEFLVQETKQAIFAERSAEIDYSEGIENSGILEILESQRRANNARASLINIKNNRLQNRIDLHLALGGDYRTQ